MSVRSFRTSSIRTGEKRSKFWDQTTVIFDSDYELISTTVLGSNTASVTFSNLGDYSSTYKHLQIRVVARATIGNPTESLALRFNSDTGGNYREHVLFGNGSSALSAAGGASATFMTSANIAADGASANVFGAGIVDILDPYSSSKNKTIRSLSGTADSFIQFRSGVWLSTASVTSITLLPASGSTNLITGSRFSLYGIE